MLDETLLIYAAEYKAAGGTNKPHKPPNIDIFIKDHKSYSYAKMA